MTHNQLTAEQVSKEWFVVNRTIRSNLNVIRSTIAIADDDAHDEVAVEPIAN